MSRKIIVILSRYFSGWLMEWASTIFWIGESRGFSVKRRMHLEFTRVKSDGEKVNVSVSRCVGDWERYPSLINARHWSEFASPENLGHVPKRLLSQATRLSPISFSFTIPAPTPLSIRCQFCCQNYYSCSIRYNGRITLSCSSSSPYL